MLPSAKRPIMKLAPIAIGLLATASLASPAFARGTLHLLHPRKVTNQRLRCAQARPAARRRANAAAPARARADAGWRASQSDRAADRWSPAPACPVRARALR